MSQRGGDDLRRKAEEKLSKRQNRIDHLDWADLKSLAHELAVHQVELEIQNEELRRTRLEAEEVRDRYIDLFDFAPVGYFTLDEHNRIVEANLTGCQMLKNERKNILKQSFTKYISPEDSESFYLLRRKALESGARETGELEIQTAEGTSFYAQIESLKVGAESLRLAVIDVSEQRKAREVLAGAKTELEIMVVERTGELKKSEEKYRLLVENANEAVIVVQDGILKFSNEKTLELTGYSREDLTSKPYAQLIFSDDLEIVLNRHSKRIKGEDVPHRYEFRIRHKDNRIKWVEVNAVRINWEGQPASLILLNDITERKQMEQELRDYARRITQVQEEERKRIAYELHDDTAQYLSILKLQLDSLINSGKIQSAEVLEKLKYLERDAGRAVDDVRRYSHELRPGVLDNLGLQAALEQIADDFNKLNEVTVELLVEGEESDLQDEVKLGLFRIAQEALNNARKHAKAANATISLQFMGSKVRLTVIDNGTGFNTEEASAKAAKRGSLGLMSMQERAKLIDADLKIESEKGKGTTVTAEAKL